MVSFFNEEFIEPITWDVWKRRKKNSQGILSSIFFKSCSLQDFYNSCNWLVEKLLILLSLRSQGGIYKEYGVPTQSPGYRVSIFPIP